MSPMDQITTPDNPIAQYKRDADIRTLTELAARLGVSKGNASDLLDGSRRIGPKLAHRLAPILGRPWHEIVSPPIDGEADDENEAAA